MRSKDDKDLAFVRREEVFFFNKASQVEQIREDTSSSASSFLRQKYNAYKIMDLSLYKFFKRLPRGIKCLKMFK